MGHRINSVHNSLTLYEICFNLIDVYFAISIVLIINNHRFVSPEKFYIQPIDSTHELLVIDRQYSDISLEGIYNYY